MSDMTRNNNSISFIAMAALMLSLLFLGFLACSDGEGGDPGVPEPQYAKLLISLNASGNYLPFTKAEELNPDVEEESQYERWIQRCWVVIFNKDGSWNTTVSTERFTIGNALDNSESYTTVELPVGSYMAYAFANLHNLEEGDALIEKLENGKDGDTPLTTDNIDRAVSLISQENFVVTAKGRAIPMSSYGESFTVAAGSENQATIPMFRMLGKATISIANNTSKPLTLNELSMGSFRTGPIFLVPYKEGDITLGNIEDKNASDKLSPRFPENENESTYTQTLANKDTNPKPEIPSGGKQVYSFYAFETGTGSNTGGDSDLSIRIDAEGRTASDKSTGFSFVRRNDWLKIPIAITDVKTTFRFENTRMPIGGLPRQIVYGDPDGFQLLVTAVNEIAPDYAGPVKVEFELKSISNGPGVNLSDLKIVYPSDDPGTGVSKPWSEARLTDNTSNLLINKESGKPMTAESDISLSPSMEAGTSSPTKGYFEVWTQELGNKADATIQLTLVAEYGTGSPRAKIEIPYTIHIQNYKKTSDTTKGGKS